jgi:transcription-repair coupling factor (superfamily II helicase)
VEAGPKGGVVTFHESFSKPAALVALLQEKPYLKLRPDQKLVRTASWTSLAERIKGVKSLISMLENL